MSGGVEERHVGPPGRLIADLGVSAAASGMVTRPPAAGRPVPRAAAAAGTESSDSPLFKGCRTRRRGHSRGPDARIPAAGKLGMCVIMCNIKCGQGPMACDANIAFSVRSGTLLSTVTRPAEVYYGP